MKKLHPQTRQSVVSIARLRDHLSLYLNRVRQGEEILIRDRKAPIAKIVPLRMAKEFDARTLALAAAGKLRLPQASLPDSFWSITAPGPRISLKQAIAAVVDARDED